MSYTIFTSNPTALIAQPGRAVNTFPSGLVRVDQTYLGQTAYTESHRATLAVGSEMPDGDSSPCIDGLFIFPEVQERRREDGFTEFIVSAYGRVKSTATFERAIKGFSRFQYSFYRGTAVARIVSHTVPDFDSLNFPADTFDPVSAFYFGGADGDYQANSITKISTRPYYTKWRFDFGGTTRDWYFLQPGLSAESDWLLLPLQLTISQTNFGYWTEWVFAYG